MYLRQTAAFHPKEDTISQCQYFVTGDQDFYDKNKPPLLYKEKYFLINTGLAMQAMFKIINRGGMGSEQKSPSYF